MAAVCYAALLVLGHIWLNWGNPNSDIYRFGWEYGNIAEALAEGRGFSDSMGHGSGPTAWMPPLLAFIYAFAFFILGTRSHAAAMACCLLKCLALGFCFYLLLQWARQLAGPRGQWAAALLALVEVFLDRHRLFGGLNDEWLVNLASCLALYLLLELAQHRERALAFPGWPVVLSALALPLISPTCTLGLGVGCVTLALSSRREGRPLRPILVVLLLCSLSTAMWTIRNRVVVGGFYPIKSNLWFDFLEANLWDDDGILSASFAIHFHPFNRNPIQDRYNLLGERDFLRTARTEVAQISLRRWASRCRNRIVNCAFRLQSDQDCWHAVGLRIQDRGPLIRAHLAYSFPDADIWTYCYWDPAEVDAELRSLQLPDTDRLIKSRHLACDAVSLRQSRWDFVLWSYWLTLLPTLASLVLVFDGLRRSRRSNTTSFLCLTVYWTFFVPYILVSHTARYQESVVYLQMLLEVAALQVLGCLPAAPP